MTCDLCLDNFTAYLEGSLPEAERAELEAHLASCATCEAALREFQQALVMLQALPVVEPPAGLAARVLAELQADIQPARRPWWQTTSSLAAAAALMIGLTFWGFTHWRAPGEATTTLPPAASVGVPAPESAGSVAPSPVPVAGPEATTPQAEKPQAEAGPASATSGLPGRKPKPTKGGGSTAPRLHGVSPVPRRTELGSGNAGKGVTPAPEVEPSVAGPGEPMEPAGSTPAARAMAMKATRSSADNATSPLLAQGFIGTGAAVPQAETFGPSGFDGGTRAAPGAPGMAPPVPVQDGAQVRVLPPVDCVVGRPTWISISITSDIPAQNARLSVASGPGLEFPDAQDGVIYRGPLAKRRTVYVPVEVIAQRTGPAHLWVTLRSEQPELAVAFPATTPAFRAARGEDAVSTTATVTLAFDERPIREAFLAVGQQAGVRVIPGDGVGTWPVTIDFSRGVPVDAALKILADAGGYKLVRTRDAYRIETQSHAAPH